LSSRVARATSFVAAASGLLGVLDLVSTLVCIRLWITTADFGAATLAIALFPIVDRLGGGKLGDALVRDPDDESTVAWLALGIGAIACGTLVLARPIVALLVQPLGASLVAAYAVRLVIQASSVVPEARLRRELRFGELSAIRVIAGLVETATKLGFAAAGAHVWCFALGPIANTIVTSAGVQLREPWRPRLHFAPGRARSAAKFAGALSAGELMYYAYTSADYLVVGAWFGDAAVGAYRLAYELVLDVVKLVSSITAEVAYPVFAAGGDAVATLAKLTRQNAIAIAPIIAFIGLEADALLRALYGPLPAAAATAARILCAVGALRIVSFVIPPMLAGVGQPRRVLAYHAIALVVLPSSFAIAAALGSDLTAVAWGWAAGYPIAFAALLALAHVSIAKLAGALGPIMVAAAIALAAGYAVRGNLVVAALAMLAVYVPLIYWIEIARARAAKAPDRAPSRDT
jgi:PST family polysaccharide transporter/lipopolysaccharide exporter